MMRFCSVHTHSTHCDGKNTLAEMAQAAFETGAVSFGASGHCHTDFAWDQGSVLPADPKDYRTEVLRLKEAYAGRMDVLLGIEQESLAPQPVPEWAEFWIGSVHSCPAPSGGNCCVDYDPETLVKGCETQFGGDWMALAEAYFAQVGKIAAARPTILGHLDLVMKFNEGNRFFDETCPRYRAAALDALRQADPASTLLEINTGAMARGFRDTPYPAQFLLREWRERGGRVILTADAHSAAAVVYGYDRAAEWARAAGFSRASLLTLAGEIECPL